MPSSLVGLDQRAGCTARTAASSSARADADAGRPTGRRAAVVQVDGAAADLAAVDRQPVRLADRPGRPPSPAPGDSRCRRRVGRGDTRMMVSGVVGGHGVRDGVVDRLRAYRRDSARSSRRIVLGMSATSCSF